MFQQMLIAAALALLTGVIIKILLDRCEGTARITMKELIIGSIVVAALAIPMTTYAGWQIAKGSMLSYNENWNGWETAAVQEDVECRKNGSCKYEYRCDCRQVCSTRDSKGNCTSYRQDCDQCPYFTNEVRYKINTTLGDYSLGQFAYPDYQNRIRSARGVPGGFSSRDYEIPQAWLQCQARVNAGKPGPVTKRMSYENYILASETTILREYSPDIAQLSEAQLLPPLRHEISGLYSSDRVSFVGFQPSDETAWQNSLAYLNAGLGTELQGDLHLVITNNEQITNAPDRYILALKAYWQNPKVWGDNAISKNSIIVVLGTTDGQTVSWARAETGMPMGNDTLRIAVRETLPEVALTPDAVLGSVSGEFYTDEENEREVRSLHDGGALERVLWGLDDPATKFTRVSMTGEDEGDVGSGFLYLGNEIQPTTKAKVAIHIVTFIICSLIWVGFAYHRSSDEEASIGSSFSTRFNR